MSNKNLNKHFSDYLSNKITSGAMISVSGFKKYILSKKLSVVDVINCDAWPGVRGELEVYYEDFLLEKAAAGGRNSQTYTQLLNKFYDKQARRGADAPVVKVVLDFKNDGNNKL